MPIHYYWIIAGVAFLILEIITVPIEFLFTSIGLAGIFTGILAYLGLHNVKIQVIIFIISSLAIFFTVRPIAKKFLYSKKDVKTNINSYVGKTAKVIQPINNLHDIGRVTIFGEEWRAKSVTNEIIDEGAIVIIEEIEDLTLLVSKKI